MKEKAFLSSLTIVMTCGLIGVIVCPAAHIGRATWTLEGTFVVGILLNVIYGALRRRFALSILAEPGIVRRFFWLCLSVPSLVLVLAISVDLFNRTLPPFSDAIHIMQQSSIANAKVGEPVRIGWPVEGSSAISGDSGHTFLRIPIAGQNGQGTLKVIGTKSNGVWKVDELTLTMRDSDAHDDLLSAVSR